MRISLHPDRRQLALFFGKVELDQFGCWIWRAARSSDCYGVFNGENAHRTAYRWFVAEIPEAWTVDHLCRRRYCVNPAHLEAVTRSENLRRVNDALGVCRRGHPWTGNNIMLMATSKGPARTCIICRRASEERRYLRNQASVHANQQ